ncbi:MAG: hypothetical protein ACFFD2_27860 [Promethearchaeota archaeon]
MFETIIALTSSNIRKINSVKFIKSFASFNWSSVQIEINCRPRRKHNGPFSMQYNNFNTPAKKMVQCKKAPLESIAIQGMINNSRLSITCIFNEGTTHWFEAKIEGENRNIINIIETQLMNIFKVKTSLN